MVENEFSTTNNMMKNKICPNKIKILIKKIKMQNDQIGEEYESFIIQKLKILKHRVLPGHVTLAAMKEWNEVFDKSEPRSIREIMENRTSRVIESEDQKLEHLNRKLVSVCHSNSSTSQSIDIIRGGLDPFKASGSLEKYGAGNVAISKAVGCVLGSMFGEEDSIHGDVSTRVHTFIKDAKVLAGGSYGLIMVGNVVSKAKGIQSSENLVAIKTSIEKPNDTENDKKSLIHDAFIGFAIGNNLREIIPNILFTYTYFKCLPPIINTKAKTVEIWCPTTSKEVEKTSLYLVTENLSVRGKSIDFYGILENPKQYKHYPRIVLSIISQVACALAIAWKKYRFTHNDFHPGNVLISNLPLSISDKDVIPQGETVSHGGDAKTVMIPYDLSSEINGSEVLIEAQLLGTIIDYGFVYAEVGGKKYATVNMLRYGITTNQPHSRYDMFKLIGYVLHDIRNIGDKKLYDAFLHLMIPFTSSLQEAHEIVKGGRNDLYYFHPPMLSDQGKLIETTFPIASILQAIQVTCQKLTDYGYDDFVKRPIVVFTSSPSSSPQSARWNDNIPIWRIQSRPSVSEQNRKILEILTKSPKFEMNSFYDLNMSLFLESANHHQNPKNIQLIRDSFDFDQVDNQTSKFWNDQIDHFQDIIKHRSYQSLSLVHRNYDDRENLEIVQNAIHSARACAKILNIIALWKNDKEAYEISCIAMGRSASSSNSPTGTALKRFSQYATKWMDITIPSIRHDEKFVIHGRYKQLNKDLRKKIEERYPETEIIHTKLLEFYDEIMNKIYKKKWLTTQQLQILESLAKTSQPIVA